MKFDTWVYHTTGSTWEELGGMAMPAAKRHRLYDDYEQYCKDLGIQFDLSANKGVTLKQLVDIAAKVTGPPVKKVEEFEFEDTQWDKVKVTKSLNHVEVDFQMMEGDDPTEAVTMFFDERHLPHFRRILEMLEQCCSHSETQTVPITGTNETITVCAKCGKEL